jgi:hypothetical protein
MKWPIWVWARQKGSDGKWYRLDRTVEGAGDAEGAVLKALNSSLDPGGGPVARSRESRYSVSGSSGS